MNKSGKKEDQVNKAIAYCYISLLPIFIQLFNIMDTALENCVVCSGS